MRGEESTKDFSLLLNNKHNVLLKGPKIRRRGSAFKYGRKFPSKLRTPEPDAILRSSTSHYNKVIVISQGRQNKENNFWLYH